MPVSDVPTELPSTRRQALDRLVPLIYAQLRAIAHNHRAAHGQHDSLTTTGLVHEAYLKLVDHSHAGWNDRVHFLALASVAMRHVLVDQARSRATGKRGGDRWRVALDSTDIACEDQPDAVLHINEALDRLAAEEPRLARVVECRFFGGMTESEIAEALSITERTVQRDWAKARMLLRRALTG
jgi:RNA polymerase sigma factor (TIGR02999 family)